MNPLGLPHAYPFLLLDRVVALDPGRAVVAIKNVTHTDPLLDATGRLPPVFLAEVMTQAAGVAVGTPADGSPPPPGMLVRIDRFRVRGAVTGGDQLWVYVRIVRTFGATVLARGVVDVDGRRCAAAELVLAIR